MNTNVKTREEVLSNLNSKWGEEAMELGWTAVPTALLFLQSEIGLSPTGLNIVLNLVMHWWSKNETPFPSQEAMCQRIGVSKRTLQREIDKLCERKIIHKKSSSIDDPKYRGRNSYDLSPLISKINEKTPILIEKMRTKRASYLEKRKGNYGYF